jgi:hypothetical protein
MSTRKFQRFFPQYRVPFRYVDCSGTVTFRYHWIKDLSTALIFSDFQDANPTKSNLFLPSFFYYNLPQSSKITINLLTSHITVEIKVSLTFLLVGGTSRIRETGTLARVFYNGYLCKSDRVLFSGFADSGSYGSACIRFAGSGSAFGLRIPILVFKTALTLLNGGY